MNSSLDPRLQDVNPPGQSYEAQRPSHPYPDVSSQPPGYEASQPGSTPTSATRGPGQQHQYYGMPTPTAYPGGHHSNNHDQSYENSPTSGNPSDPNDLKRPRACEACRQLKVRCEPDDNSPTGSCKRCAKANRPCVVTVPSRKRQKKTDSRVAELEKKIDALTASLIASRNGQDAGDAPLDPAIAQAQAQAQMAELQHHRDQLYEERQWPPNSRESISSQPTMSPTVPKAVAGSKRKMSTDRPTFQATARGPADSTTSKALMPQMPNFGNLFQSTSPGPRIIGSDGPYIDVIDRQILDINTAYRIFDRYNTEMYQQLPIVVFPPGTKAEDIRHSKPLVFLAVLAVASAPFRPDLQSSFISEATKIIADRIIYRGEKSLELVQTVQLITVFYQPPEKYEELNFNQLIHVAAVMALDIGMGKRAKPGAFAVWRDYMDKSKSPYPDPNSAETRRTWLGCYYMCANAAMSLRRSPLIRWSPYNDECLELLTSRPNALQSDKWLCHLVRAQHIAEEVGFQFSMDDPASVMSLTDTKTQYHLKAFERQLAEWRQSFSKAQQKPLIQHTEAIINLYMHEIAMHHNHNIDDFKPPYNIAAEENTDDTDFVTPAHIDSLTICLSSIHNAFDAFLSMDIKDLRALPTLFYVRNSYAAVALIKMYSAVTARGSKFGTIFQIAELRVEYYLDALINTLKRAAEGNQSRVAHKFSFIFNMLKGWHMKRIESERVPKTEVKSLSGTEVFDNAPIQDSNSQSWNNLPVGTNPKAQHSGLQMLSDAAMVKNASSTADPAAAAAAALAASSNGEAWGNPGYPGQITPGAPIVGDAMMTYGLAGPELDTHGFTPDELNAMGSLMEDPGWLGFGAEMSGWTF